MAGHREIVFRFIAAPKMKSVGENNVAEHLVRFVIRDVESGIHLEVRGNVPSYAERGGVLPAALEIHLHSEFLVEIVGITEDRFVLRTGMDGADDHLVVLGVVTGFQVGLGIDMAARGPVDEPDR
jgi:hypothetical protein